MQKASAPVVSSHRIPFRPRLGGRYVLTVLAAAAVHAVVQAQEPPAPAADGAPVPAAVSPSGRAESASESFLRTPYWQGAASGGLFESRSPWSLPRQPGSTAGVRSASYPVDAGFVRVVPSVVVLPDLGPASPGLVGVGVERAISGDPLRWKAHLGWSGVPSGSFEVDYRVADRNVVIKGEERPALGALLPGGRAPGTSVESRWSERLDARTSANAVLANNRLDLDGRGAAASSAGLELEHRPADHWTVLARVDGAAYSDAATAGYRRGVVTVGTGYDGSGIGVNASYRNEASASTAGGGHGARVSVRGRAGGLSASAYADVQQQAEELEFLVRDAADLPRDFGDLGLVGMRPEAAVAAVRDRPALFARHGIVPGALRVDPLRVQGGVDLSWRPGSSGTEFGVRVAYDELDALAGPRRALLGSLYTSWSVFSGAALTASYANWSMRDGGEPDDSRTTFRMSIRAPL
jgi:hypothetical protein